MDTPIDIGGKDQITLGSGTIVIKVPTTSKYDYDMDVVFVDVEMYAMGKNVSINNVFSNIDLFAPIEHLRDNTVFGTVRETADSSKKNASARTEESGGDDVDSNERFDVDINESFTATIDEIKIDSVSCPIFIETHASEEILVEIDIKNSKSKDPFTVEISGDTLEIIQTSQNTSSTTFRTINIFGFKFESGSGTGSIVVKVPVNSKYNYEIDDAGGNVEIASINANNIGVSTGGGDITAQKISSQGNIAFGTGGGRIDLYGVNSANASRIDVSTGGGDITAEKISSQGNIAFSTGGGRIELYEVNSVNASHIDVSTGGGSIRAEKISSQGNISFGTGGGSINLSEINSASGKLTVDGGGRSKTLDTVNAKSIYISTGSGRIKLEQITCTDIDIENNMQRASGDITFSNLDAQNITIDIVSSSGGDVRGNIVGTQSDFSVTTRTDSGSTNLPNQAGSGNKTLNVSTDSGDIDISFTE